MTSLSKPEYMWLVIGLDIDQEWTEGLYRSKEHADKMILKLDAEQEEDFKYVYRVERVPITEEIE